MTRLIDADLLKENLIKCLKPLEPEEEMIDSDVALLSTLMEIDKQPTAFDVNLIVKKLEEEKTIAYDDSIDEKIRVRLWNKAIRNAIKIVEGGINE